MKYCPRCNAACDDSAAFCTSCGASVATPASAQPGFSQAPANGAWGHPPQFSNYSVPAASPAIGVLKSIASSPLFLVSTILVTLGILLQFVNAMSIGGPVSVVLNLFYEADLIGYSDYYGILEGINSLNMVSTLFSLIPVILVAVGLWLTFAAGVNKRSGGFSTTGLTMVKVINIIQLVCECILYGLVLILFLIGMMSASAASSYSSSYSSYYGYSEYGSYAESAGVGVGIIIMAVAAIIIIPVAVLRIIWYVKINRSINAAKNTALTGNGDMNVSSYVGVFCFIGAVGGFIGLIGSALTYVTVPSVLISLCSIAASVCFGILIFTYRSRMQALAMTPMPLNTMNINNVGGYMPSQPMMNTANTMNTVNSYPTSEMNYTPPAQSEAPNSFSDWDNNNG